MDFAMPDALPEPIAIVALTQSGVSLALRLQGKLPGSRCFAPRRHRFAIAMGATGFDRLKDVTPRIWSEYRAIVFILATGIAVRLIAPLLRHKTADPAVVVLDERGQFAISLLSGHLGGANRLARTVAELTGGRAVITTASDVRGKPALDLIAEEEGLEIENIGSLSRVARAILEEEPILLHDPENLLRARLEGRVALLDAAATDGQSNPPGDCAGAGSLSGGAGEPENADVNTVLRDASMSYREEPLGAGADPAPGVWVSERCAPPGSAWLEVRPRNLVVGVGCNRGTPAGEILGFLREVFERWGFSLLSIRNLASIDLKADEPGLAETAAVLRRPVLFFSGEELRGITVPNPSDMVANHVGVPSVCEATALLSARSDAPVVPKQKAKNVTLAVAKVCSR